MMASRDIMRQEIAAQPRVVRDAIPSLLRQAASIRWPDPPGLLVFCGCGDSLTAPSLVSEALGGAAVILSAMDVAAYRRLKPADVVVAASISGSTTATAKAVAAARAAGARSCAITMAPDSPIARAADHVITLPYRPISRQTPHTLDFAMTIAAVLAIAAAKGESNVALDMLPDVIAGALAVPDDQIDAAARLWSPTTNLYVLGAGPGLATARYIVAKFHEAFGCAAIAAELEDMAHGQHLALRGGDAAVLLALDQPSRTRASAVLPGLVRLGLKCAVIGGDTGSVGIDIPATDGWPAQVAAAVVGQRLCLRAAEIHDLAVIWPVETPHLVAQKEWGLDRSTVVPPSFDQNSVTHQKAGP